MITILRLSEHSVVPQPIPRKHKELLDFVDEAVRLLAKDFALTDLSDEIGRAHV